MRTLVVLASMAIGTYALRAGGLWMMARWQPPPAVQRAMRNAPGAVLAALIAPSVLGGGLPDIAAAGVTAGVALKTRSLLTAIVAGTLAVCLLRFINV